MINVLITRGKSCGTIGKQIEYVRRTLVQWIAVIGVEGVRNSVSISLKHKNRS